jgi:hypothetical protein
MISNMSQQFYVACDCFTVAVFHWHGVLFLNTLKKIIWCNLSAGLFEELDPLEQSVSA